MNKPLGPQILAGDASDAKARWEREYRESIGTDRATRPAIARRLG